MRMMGVACRGSCSRSRRAVSTRLRRSVAVAPQGLCKVNPMELSERDWPFGFPLTLRANDGETSESLKFSLEGVRQPSHGHAKQRIENEWSRWS
jgi:hypothetical protein